MASFADELLSNEQERLDKIKSLGYTPEPKSVQQPAQSQSIQPTQPTQPQSNSSSGVSFADELLSNNPENKQGSGKIQNNSDDNKKSSSNDKVSLLRGIVESINQAATFNSSDEIQALLNGAINSLKTGKPFSQTFDENLTENRGALNQFRTQHPYLSAGAELGTSLLPGSYVNKGVKALESTTPLLRSQVAQNTVSGGIQGALAGAGNAEEDRVGGAVSGGGAGALAGGVLSSVPEIARVPKNILTTIANRASTSPAAREGQALNRELSGLLTPGQESGSKSLTILENLARQSIAPYRKNGNWTTAVDEIAAHDEKVQRAAQERIFQFQNQIGRAQSAEVAGVGIQRATDKAVEDLLHARETKAQVDYGVVRTLANNRRLFTFDNVARELSNIIQENTRVTGADNRKVLSQAQDMLGEFLQRSGRQTRLVNLDIDTALRNRSAWSKASKGTGNLFQDIAPSLNRQLASRIARAAGKDFEDFGNRIGQPDLKQALDRANINYKQFSQSINAIEQSALGKLLGREVVDDVLTGGFNTVSGEKAYSKLMKLPDSEIRLAVGILGQADDQIISQLKATSIYQALLKGRNVAPSSAANGTQFSFNKYISALPDKNKMKALGFSQDEIQESKRIVNALLRAGDRTGYNWSGTNVQAQAGNYAAALGGLLTGAVKGMATIAGYTLGIRHIAQAMTDRQGRMALYTLTRPGATEKQIVNALTTMGAYKAGSEVGYGQ